MAATSGSAGWDRGCWSRRSSFAGSRDTNRFRCSSENWKLWHRLSWGLSNGERRRRVDYAGVATFNGVPGIPRHHRQIGSGGEFVAHFLSLFGSETVESEKLRHPAATANSLQSQVEAWMTEI